MMESVEPVADLLQRHNKKLATAESCTGGWIAQEVTAMPGSSAWFDCGFITYSNEAKQRMLGVAVESLDEYGAVSAEVVREMVLGAIAHSSADIAVATSGIAGPAGGTLEKPVGTVWFAWGDASGRIETEKVIFSGNRESVRKQAVNKALQGILQFISC